MLTQCSCAGGRPATQAALLQYHADLRAAGLPVPADVPPVPVAAEEAPKPKAEKAAEKPKTTWGA